MRFRLAIALSAGLLAIWSMTGGAAQTTGPAQFLGSFRWQSPQPGFGGLSALEIAADGTEFIALSDGGSLIAGSLHRENGVVSAIDERLIQALLDPNGNIPQPYAQDSEGLALGRNGTLYVSFEGFARVWSYPPGQKKARWIPRIPAFKEMPVNGALEALAIDSRGHLHTMSETLPKGANRFPVYRFTGTSWETTYGIPARDGFLPVGADFGPDGWFYLLERDFTGINFRSRVRRFLIHDDQIVAEELVFQSAAGQHDNLEGIAVWRDEQDRIRMTMVSDDNFRIFQRTEIVEYALPKQP